MKRVIASLFTLLSLPAAMAATTAEKVLEHYYVIQDSLASDSLNGVLPAARKISLISQAAPADAKTMAQLSALSAAAAGLNAPDIKTVRLQFGELSKRLTAYLQAAGEKKNPPYQFFCSMAQKGWLQPDRNTRNPYYGSSMLKCGDLIQ